MQRQACLDYAEVQLILYKDNANRMQRQACLDYAEVQLILYKDSHFIIVFVNRNKIA